MKRALNLKAVLRTAGVIALAVVFGVGMSACYLASTPLPGAGGGGEGDGDGDGDGDGELVDKVIFNLQDPQDTDVVPHTLQNLPIGALSFGAGNPIAPLERAAGDEHADYEIIEVDGKKALKYVTHATWGPGFDLRNGVFGFRAGDEITIIGSATGANIDLALNVNQNFTQKIIGERITETGPFTIEVELTAADVADITGSSNELKTIRFEDRASTDTTVTITQILIEGKRPSTIAKLAAPVISETGGVVSWTAITGAGGYKVFEGANVVATLLSTETSYNLALSALDPGGPYTITVVALGVSGSSTDSDPSNAVSYTKPAPVIKTVVFSTAMLSADATQGTVVAVGTTGYTWTADLTGGWGNGFASFKFDLEGPLSDFIKITFDYTGRAGDYNSKGVKLFAGVTAPTGYLNGGNGLAETASTGSVTVDVAKEITLILDAAAVGALTGELWFTIYIPMDKDNSGTASSYTVSNVKFYQ